MSIYQCALRDWQEVSQASISANHPSNAAEIFITHLVCNVTQGKRLSDALFKHLINERRHLIVETNGGGKVRSFSISASFCCVTRVVQE